MNLQQTDKAAQRRKGGGSQTGASPSCVRLSVRPSTHLSASSHWRRALMSASSAHSSRLRPSGILMCLSAPCGGEHRSVGARPGRAGPPSGSVHRLKGGVLQLWGH